MYHDRSYLIDGSHSKERSLKSLKQLADNIRDGELDKMTITTDDGDTVPVRSISLSKHQYGINPISGEPDGISAKDWLKLYTDAKTDGDRLSLADYQYMQYMYGKDPMSVTSRADGSDGDDVQAPSMPWWIYPALAGVVAAGAGAGAFLGSRYLINKIAK